MNRAFYCLARDSPSIRYEIDLFGTGLQRNPRTKAPLMDCRAALKTYCEGWETLNPVEEWDVDLESLACEAVNVVGGTVGILLEDSVKFITLGSILRGIPRKEWDIPLGDFESFYFAFCPRTDLLVIVEVEFM